MRSVWGAVLCRWLAEGGLKHNPNPAWDKMLLPRSESMFHPKSSSSNSTSLEVTCHFIYEWMKLNITKNCAFLFLHSMTSRFVNISRRMLYCDI
jgi:hypothetical protein